MQGKVIGIVGGGQLARMLTLAAKPLGFHIVVINPHANSPAAQVGADEIIADLYDEAALRKLAELSDYITVEIEHLNTDALEAIETFGTPVNPAPKTIKLIQDKLRQKQFLQKQGMPVAPFAEIKNLSEAKELLDKLDGKMLIKTRHGAYDGRGNMVVKNKADIRKAFDKFSNQGLYAEAYVPFACELAVMVSRSADGQVAVYPVVKTVHTRNICIETLTPAEINKDAERKARRLAKRVAENLQGAGVFGIEMFLTEQAEVLVNEIAPRVHNSGHYTIDACRTSQFEQHIRAISGLPLGSTDMIVPAAVMVNILGERDGPTHAEGIDKALATPHVSVHLYGKSPTKVDRKMGHVTATGNTIEVARKRAHNARKKIKL